MQLRNRARQAGFTLVEIAIVLVIIGLLLGGVLKGQEMIENAKVKNGINDMNGISAAYNSYIDRFRQLPGDDGEANLAALRARGGSWTTVTVNGNRNGVIGQGLNAITQVQVFNPPAAQESTGFWQQLRAAGLISGNPASTALAALPRNAFNGVTGVGLGVGVPATAARFSICMSQVPGKAARAIDIQLDDGLPNGGSIQSTLGAVPGTNTAPGAAAVAYSDDNNYTLCRTL